MSNIININNEQLIGFPNDILDYLRGELGSIQDENLKKQTLNLIKYLDNNNKLDQCIVEVFVDSFDCLRLAIYRQDDDILSFD